MTPQVLGQALVTAGFIGWVVSWSGLLWVSWFAAYCRQPLICSAALVSALPMFGVGVCALSTIPGSIQ